MGIRLLSGMAWMAILTPLGAQEGADGGDIFDLSPFEVVVEDANSYLAKNAVSATKFNTVLKDIPISLQVMTDAFMEDTLSLDLESAMEFAASVNDATDQGGTRESGVFSIRGFRIDRAKRDGVVSYYGQDMTNIARVEVMKGPASLLYGQTEPGGIINFVPKRPLDEPRYGVDLTVGSDGFRRARIEATGPLLERENGKPRLLYRIDASAEEEDGWKRSEAHEKTFISPVLEYRFTERAKLTFQYERHDQDRVTVHGLARMSSFGRQQWLDAEDDPDNPSDLKTAGTSVGGISGALLLRSDAGLPVLVSPDPDTPGRFILNPNLPGVAGDGRWDDGTGALRDDPRFFVTDPDAATSRVALVIDSLVPVPYDFVPELPSDFNRLKRDFFSLDFQSPMPWEGWFLRVVAVHDRPSLDILESRHLPLANYAGNGVRYTNANFSSTFFENEIEHYQANLTGRWDLGPVFNQTILGAELIENAFRNEIWNSLAPPDIASAGELIRLIGDEARPFIPPSRLLEFDSLTVRDRSTILPSTASLINHSEGYYFSNLASFWEDRFKVLVGIRYGRAYTETYRGNSTGEPTVEPWQTLTNSGRVTDKVTPQYGLIYAPNDSLSFYASYSESFWPNSDLLRRINDAGTAIEPLVPAEPLEGVGTEGGLKVDLFNSRLSGSVAVFEIERRNIITSEPADDPGFPNESIQVQGASETSTGLDLDLIYSPLDNLQMVFGYAYIESEVALGEAVGFDDAIGVPEHNFTFWGKYTFTEGTLEDLSLGFGVNYSGSRRLAAPLRGFLENGNESTTLYDGSFTRLSLLLSYETRLFGKPATVSLNVKNLTDEKAFLPPGRPIDPRQVYLSFKYDF